MSLVRHRKVLEPSAVTFGAEADQIAYLNAIHDLLGSSRLIFWVNLLLTDFMIANGQCVEESGFLEFFGHAGFQYFDRSPKPALEVLNRLRAALQALSFLPPKDIHGR